MGTRFKRKNDGGRGRPSTFVVETFSVFLFKLITSSILVPYVGHERTTDETRDRRGQRLVSIAERYTGSAVVCDAQALIVPMPRPDLAFCDPSRELLLMPPIRHCCGDVGVLPIQSHLLLGRGQLHM